MTNHGGVGAGLLLGLAAAAVVGCGGEAEKAAPPSLPDEALPFGGPPIAALRIDLARAAGAVKIQRAARLTTPPPVRALGGDLVAVAWADDGTVVDAAPIALTTTLLSAGSDDAGNFVESADAEDPGAASGTVFLKDSPTLDRIEVVDASGTVVATVRGGEIGSSTASGALRAAAETVAGFHADFAWVTVLGQANADLLPTALRGQVTGLVEPTADHMSMFRDCFTRMSEAEKLSVTTIGVATLPDQGRTILPDGQHCKVVLGKTEGSTFVINADYNGTLVNQCIGPSKSRRFVYSCLHEGAHTFTNLVPVANTTAGWPDQAQTIAQQVVAEYNLSAGLEAQFTAMQASAVAEAAATAAKDYGAPQASDDTAVAAGFATAYGSEKVVDDIAEYVAQIQGGKDLLGVQPPICALFAGAKKLSARTAIQYAKAVLLRGIGLIDDAQFALCTRGFGITSTPGIEDPGTTFQFTDNLDFGYFDQADERMFGVAGDGADSAQFLLRVLVKNGQPPLGLSRLERLTMVDIDAAKNGVLVGNDNVFAALTSTGGLALITEISDHSAAGAILSLDLGQLGLVDVEHHPMVTFRVSK